MSDFRAINSAIIRVFILTFVSALENTIPFMSEITPIPVDDISSFVYGEHMVIPTFLMGCMSSRKHEYLPTKLFEVEVTNILKLIPM